MSLPLLSTEHYSAFIYPNESAGVIAIQPHRLASDGTSSNRPSRPRITGQAILDDGTVDYFEKASDDVQRHWKTKLGGVIAKHMVRMEARKQGKNWNGHYDFAFIEFPDGYELYTHKTGDRHVPRIDHYLFGSKYVHVFRSTREFAPHLLWLLRGKPMKPDGGRDCDCQYCDGSATQTDISRKYFNVPAREPREPAGGSNSKPRQKQPRAPRQTVPIPAKDYTKLSSNR
ncbi:hypothetical protein OBBRIDRAFT_647255 [Obba rivulosa]|uniref:Cryptic loci regulator 2 N-terminal domain-containing protein n=1 Tax=Obba rivulosa TaxID=1052685 RepID=A0A8E2DSV4_9APHY|nr:hypothetical protein OBBRIDRAFT_647255 [Obba rivulosa]